MEDWERWALGVSLALLNCVMNSIGFTLQRKAHLLAEENIAAAKVGSRAEEGTERISSWIFSAGVALCVLAACPDVVSYTLVPQVVCSTCSCFRLVLVTILAHFCLGEKATFREVLGMMICSAGTYLCLRFGPVRSSIDVAEDGFSHPQIFIYLATGGLLVVLLLAFDCCQEVRGQVCQICQHLQMLILPLGVGLVTGMEKIFNTELGYMQPPALPAGFFSQPRWLSMLSSLGILGIVNFYLNIRGTKQLPVKIFIPLSFAAATVLQYIQSAVLFEEFSEMTYSEAALSMCGACLSLIGALTIQPPSFRGIASTPREEQHVQLVQTDEDVELNAIPMVEENCGTPRRMMMVGQTFNPV